MIKQSLQKTASSLAIIFVASALPASAQELVFETPYWTEAPVIEAQGRATLEVPPNRASFNVQFKETDKDAKDAMELAVQRGRAAYDTIKAVARESARVQTSVSVDPYYEQYRVRDGDRVENRRADKVKGYEAIVSVNVEVTDVSKAGEARAAALALAPESSSSLRTYLERTAELDRKAYEAAVADAAARARASASAANARLGKLLVLQEGQGPCLGQWTSQPGVVVRNRSVTHAAPAVSRTAPRALETVTVTATKRGGEDIVITQDDIDALNLPSDETPETVQARVCAVYAVGP